LFLGPLRVQSVDGRRTSVALEPFLTAASAAVRVRVGVGLLRRNRRPDVLEHTLRRAVR